MERANLTGQRFGMLTVSKYAETRTGKAMWHCRCRCGVEKLVSTGDLRSGKTHSCGCGKGIANVKHGLAGTLLYMTWRGIKARCNNPNHKSYANYGGRGIRVCDRWSASFEAFCADMGAKPTPAHSIDRINNDGDYEPSNCRWATPSEQETNKRRQDLAGQIVNGAERHLEAAE